MAFSTPATVVAGNVLTAAYVNTYVRDNVAWLATDSPSCRIYKSVAFSHNSPGSWLAVTCDSERFDNASMHSTSSNTARMTAPTGGGGKYVLGGSINWLQGSATGQRLFGIGINGIAVFAAAQGGGSGSASATINTAQSILCIYSMSAADYAQGAGYQDSGGTVSIDVQANFSPEFYAFWFRT